MFQMLKVHNPQSTVEIRKSSFRQETDDANEYEIAEEMMEEAIEEEEEETDIQELDVTERSGMRYDLDETIRKEKREKPKAFVVMVCWMGLAYSGLHSLCRSKTKSL